MLDQFLLRAYIIVRFDLSILTSCASGRTTGLFLRKLSSNLNNALQKS